MMNEINTKEMAVANYVKQIGKGVRNVVKGTRTSQADNYFSSEHRNEHRLKLIEKLHTLAMEAIDKLD